MSTLVIGDIHGCYTELRDLLDRAALNSDDTILAVGDLYDRGPEPGDVFTFFRDTPEARSIQGNHEAKHIDALDGTKAPPVTQMITRWQLGHEYDALVEMAAGFPLYADLTDALVVHGYFEPGLPPDQQRPDVLLGTSSGEAYLAAHYDRAWFQLYDGDKPVIVGHRDYTMTAKVFNYADRVFGIDTRCVYGGALTGLLLPEWRFVSVPARDDHWSTVRARHGV